MVVRPGQLETQNVAAGGIKTMSPGLNNNADPTDILIMIDIACEVGKSLQTLCNVIL